MMQEAPSALTVAVFGRDIGTVSNAGLTLMPAGFESAITAKMMADLLAVLRLPL